MGFPLAGFADKTIAQLAAATGAKRIATLDGLTLLCERAVSGGLFVPGRTSAGGGCRLFDAATGTVALNLARADDREMLPALLETDEFDLNDTSAISALIARCDARALVLRGRSMGLAISSENEMSEPPPTCMRIVTGCPAAAVQRRAPRVLDLSSLWAGPLASHLLWLAGAEVTKVESRTRPDALRWGDAGFYALLNQGKDSVALAFADPSDRGALLSMIIESDIVIEASRPRALEQLGIDATQIVRTTPGLVWITITGHGTHGDAADWIGFGDDCGVSGGLSAALRAASGRAGFVGDAIADPLTGMSAALVAWTAWASGQGGRFDLAMSQVVARCLAEARLENSLALENSLRQWSEAEGALFPAVTPRPAGLAATLGEHTRSRLERAARP